MADEKDSGEKTEEATPQRREDFRKRGQVAQTRELGSVLMLLSIVISMWLLGSFFLDQIHQVFTRSFTDYLVISANEEGWRAAALFAGVRSVLIVAPLGAMLWLVGVTGSLLQVGFLTNEEAFKFNPNRINPVEGLKRLFSIRSIVEGLKAIFKVVVVVFVLALILRSELLTIPRLSYFEVQGLFKYIGTVSLKLFGGVAILMGVIAAFDYLFQRWDLEKKMRMSKQELKEEIKSREGDPLVRARIKKIQRELATKRMMNDVPKADVIITNPTHIAVAIKYSNEFVSPKLLAKGADEVAERIKNVAKENNVPIVENKPVARTIFKTMKIGDFIPRELYAAVAEILSYVYKLRNRKVV